MPNAAIIRGHKQMIDIGGIDDDLVDSAFVDIGRLTKIGRRVTRSVQIHVARVGDRIRTERRPCWHAIERNGKHPARFKILEAAHAQLTVVEQKP